MTSPDRSQSSANKLTSFLNRLYTDRNYAVLESVVSAIAIAGSCWIMSNPEVDFIKQSQEQIPALHYIATGGLGGSGMYGIVSGTVRTIRAQTEIIRQERKIASKYRIRGFFLSRIVTTS